MDNFIYERLSIGALEEAAGAVSGATEPKHQFGTYGTYSHAVYNDVVMEELKQYMKDNNIKPSRKMTAAQMHDFARMMKEGKGSTKAHSKILKAFNEEVMRQREAYEKSHRRAKPIDSSCAANRKRGQWYISNTSRYASAMLVTALSTAIAESASVLNTASKSRRFRDAVEALAEGDLATANRAMVGGPTEGELGGFAGELVDAKVHATAIATFQAAWSAALARAAQRARDVRAQIKAPAFPRSGWVPLSTRRNPELEWLTGNRPDRPDK